MLSPVYKKALKIAGIYLVLGILYIIFSDELVHGIFRNPLLISRIQTYKGTAFIVVTAGILFFLIYREMKKQYESEIKIRESSRLKSVFLNNMTHEIRTPLNAIMGFSQLLNEPETTHEEKKYYAEIIKNSGKQLLRIIDDILEISVLETKQHKIESEYFSLNELIKDLYVVFSIQSKEKNIPIYLKNDAGQEDITLNTDKRKLEKILSTLIENALKFTAKGYIEIGYEKKNGILEIYVKDTGAGIAAENQEKVFDLFTQTEESSANAVGGLGIGLSIAKENTMLLGGEIKLDSEIGKGSFFTVSLPV